MRCGHRAARRLAAATLAALTLAGCAAHSPQRLRVVTTTTLLGSLAREIGGERVQAQVLVPAGSCPGHYDMRPGDAHTLARSGLLLSHGYERFVPRLLQSIGAAHPRAYQIAVEGNWLVPAVQARAARQVARRLQEVDPGHAAQYEQRLKQVLSQARTVEAQLLRDLDRAGARGRPALCSDQLTDLLRWMGFEVVGTYGRPEELTPLALHRLLEIGRAHRVRLVVDNLQSGPRAGEPLARDLGAARVTLSNFPGGFSGTDNWEACLRDNVRRVVTALGAGALRDRGGRDG